MEDPETTKSAIEATTETIVTSAKASALVESKGASTYHAEEPGPEILADMAKLLEYDPVHAVIHMMVSVIGTTEGVIKRTAQRDHALMGLPVGFVSVNGLLAALTMSLSDFTIAMGEVGGIETPHIEKLREEMERLREEGTLDAAIAANKMNGAIPEGVKPDYPERKKLHLP